MRGNESGACISVGNINRKVTFGSLLLANASASFDTSCKFDEDMECNDCRLDVEIKPGGASTPSSISIARCSRACLSQSSSWYSSGENLYGVFNLNAMGRK